MNTIAHTRVAVVGSGRAASSFAYTLLLGGLHPQIILIDPEMAKAEEQALDLQQATIFFQPQEVRAGTMAELSQAAMIVFCGVNARPGETAPALLDRNLALVRDISARLAGNHTAILLMGAAPSDLLTYAAWKLTGLPSAQVIGTGTIAETATLRYLLGRHFRVDPNSVHAYVLGGNGGRVPIWSSATIAGLYVREVCKAHGCPPAVLQSIFNEVLDRTTNPDHPQAGKLSAGAGLARIAAAILGGENHVCSASAVLNHEYGLNNSAMSVPLVIGEKGIDRILRLELSDEEVAHLLACGEKTQRAIKKLDLMPHQEMVAEAC